MKSSRISLALFIVAFLTVALLSALPGAKETRAQNIAAHELMSFFITSSGPGNGADLGGLDGADKHCQTLAEAVGSEGRDWRAYLSAHATQKTAKDDANNAVEEIDVENAVEDVASVNARDRIGAGPWHNSKGELVADNVGDLHGENSKLSKEISLNEKGEPVNGRGDRPNMHDILTGSNLDGTLFAGEGDTACENWTSDSEDGSARVGHHDRNGGGQNPTSWNSAHGSRGCGQANLQATGGNGLFYCFAVAKSAN